MSNTIGIDLGTTNSVACVWRRGRAETIPVEGRTTMPSAVSVLANGTVLVGQAAKNRAMIEPGSSVTSPKRWIGDGVTKWEILGRSYTPVDVSRMVLERLKKAAEDHLGGEVTEAVVTVPAYFNNNQKRDTKLAAEGAGLEVLQLLPEPTAAAISYGLDQGKDQMLLVYDLGGGTFDVSVLRVKGNDFKVLAVDGDFHLGGDDFDNALVEHLIKILAGRTKRELGILQSLFGGGGALSPVDLGTSQEMLRARQQLKEAAEMAKKDLAQCDTAWVRMPEILGVSLDEEIRIETYNGLIEPLVKRTTDKIREVLRTARLDVGDIDRVILVGGSTRNRLVKQRVAESVKEPWTSERVDEVVGQGAAIVAAHLTAPTEDMTPEEIVPPIVLSNVTPFSLGVRITEAGDRDFFLVLIPKNTPLADAKACDHLTTLHEKQSTVKIAVFQGESAKCSENTFIGGFKLSGIPPAPAGVPGISVRLELDQSDLLVVTAECDDQRQQCVLDVNKVVREEDLAGNKRAVDVMFLIDTSGGMNAELDGVKKSGMRFAARVIAAGVDCRLGLMDFDLPLLADSYNWEVFGPMEPSKFSAAISGLRIGRLGGGGCYVGETNSVPVIRAFAKAYPTKERTRIGILISDEVGDKRKAVDEIVGILQADGITLHVVGVAGSCHAEIARKSGGKFRDIHASRGHVDFASLLDSIASEIISLVLK